MKTLLQTSVAIFLIIFAILLSKINAQTISPDDQQRAIKEGKKEAEKLLKKGWQNNLPATDLETSLIRAYEAKYTTDSNDVKFYVPAFGNAYGATKEEAENVCLEKCKNSMFDIMMLYFYMWNTTNDKITDTEKSQVEDALKTVGEKIKEEYALVKYETVANIFRQDGDRVEMQVRVIYNQQECKDVAKREIKKVLSSKYEISNERAEQLLTYPK